MRRHVEVGDQDVRTSGAGAQDRGSIARYATWSRIAVAAALVIGASCSVGGGANGGGGDSLFTQHPEAGGYSPGPGGPVIAVLELNAPAQSSFVLHGTIPVPKDTFPRPDGKLPFAIRNSSGNVVPTQVEIVSRYPNDNDGAAVVEVLGRVDRPAGAATGAKIQYQVVDHVHASGKMPIKKDVLTLLTQPGGTMLVATDCFGHQYGVDLFKNIRTQSPGANLATLRQGPAAVQMRTYDVMMPNSQVIGAPSGSLPHFFGVHAYVTAWAQEDAISLDLRVNNGPSGVDHADDKDDPLGNVYFKSLELWVPSGWVAQSEVSDPFLAQPHTQGAWLAYPLIKPNPDGSMHLMAEQAMLNRRIAISKPSATGVARALLDQAGLGFCRRGVSPDGGALYSWWNQNTANYFPQRHKLCDVSYYGIPALEQLCVNDYNNVKNILEQGTATQYPFCMPAYGYNHGWGVQYGGMTSGSEIWFYDGFKTAEAAANKGYLAALLQHRMYADRQPQCLYDKNGETTRYDEWIVHGPQFDYIPITFFQRYNGNGADPFGYSISTPFQRNYVASHGLKPSYEQDLLLWDPIDFQHYSRFTHGAKVLAWLGNDAIAKDDLRMAAEIFRLSYHEYPTSSTGGVMSSQLRGDMNWVAAHPGRGYGFGRGPAWGTDSAICAYTLSDPAWRSRWLGWFGIISDTLASGQSACNGFIQSNVNIKNLGGQWYTRQSIEQAITENMMWELKESVFRDVDPARFQQTQDTLRDSLYAMIGPMAWDNTVHGPMSMLAVAPLAIAQAPFCGAIPAGGSGNGGDKYQTPSSFAYGYEITGDPVFLNKAAEMFSTTALLNTIKNQGMYSFENKAALLAVLQ
jgi:hypothetical protein